MGGGGGTQGVTMTSPIWMTLGAAALVPINGRTAVDWAPVAVTYTARLLTGQTRYRARPLRPRPAGTLGLPGDAARLRLVEDPADGAAFVHDPHLKTLTTVARVRPGPFILLDPTERDRRATAWGTVLAGLCQQPGTHRVQVLQRTLPDSGMAVESWWSTWPTRADADSWVVRAYDELLTEAATTSERHETLVSLTVDLTALARPVRDQGGGLTGAVAVLRARARSLESALGGADLAVDRLLDASELAVVMRTAYDPSAVMVLDRHPEVGRQIATAGPVSVDERWAELKTESSWHQALWLAEWPRTEVAAGFLLPLVGASGVHRTFSLVCEPIPINKAMRDVRADQYGHVADQMERAERGQLESAQVRRERADVDQREAELVSGAGDVRFAGFVVVSAPSKDELASAVDQTRQAAVEAGCELRVMAGEQAGAFVAGALPLGRGI